MSNKPFIHPLAYVESKSIGNLTKIWQFCVVLDRVIIGEDCNVNALCLIESGVIIGDRVTIKSGVQLWEGIEVESDVFIGPNVTFCNDKYPRSKNPPASFSKTIVRKGASIGANSTILDGITIGEKSMVGAGSVVTKSIPSGELWVGNPAKKVGLANRIHINEEK